jgi:hypothetical protein
LFINNPFFSPRGNQTFPAEIKSCTTHSIAFPMAEKGEQTVSIKASEM